MTVPKTGAVFLLKIKVGTHMTDIQQLVTKQLTQYRPQQINAVLTLLDEGNTVPFVARYRKERTGSLDEVQIREIEHTFQYLTTLEKRKTDIIKNIAEQAKLTPALQKQIEAASQLQVLEDLYLPYKQKRRTKATIAKEAGLEPFANLIAQLPNFSEQVLLEKAADYLNPDQKIIDTDAVLAGVHEIIAENISETATFRDWTRQYTRQNGQIVSQVKDADSDDKQVYQIYYDFSAPINKIAEHQYLAINRGEHEGILKVKLEVAENMIVGHIAQSVIHGQDSAAAQIIKTAIEDAYKRFIGPAIERELRKQLKEKADQQAIAVFGDNLKHLLLQPPLKGKVVLGFDPAYRTGCKLAVVDGTGKFLDKLVIYPHKPAAAPKRAAAADEFKQFLEKYNVEMIAIGNGTASRESEEFVASVLKTISREIFYVIVNEAGASVYSASDTARAEFPDLHVEERSAISIARRLQDPLAELIKIDPQAVGVGQYQHDVAQKELTTQLDVVIEDVVNSVGVNLNTASPQLLQHISGLSATTAQNIVQYRNENGLYQKRSELKKVPRLGPKAFEQAVGFLRIIGGDNPLDNTDIHPESYPVAKAILKSLGVTLEALGTPELSAAIKQLTVTDLATELAVGSETLEDILSGLQKPGRDLRDQMTAPLLRHDVLTLADLKPNMALEGTVRNVIDFGAFVDIGVKHDGLVHISQLANHFVKHPSDEVSVGDVVQVWVLSVDQERERVQLTMKAPKATD